MGTTEPQTAPDFGRRIDFPRPAKKPKHGFRHSFYEVLGHATPRSAMTNIPTDLLRTLVAVVDLRSFTKAAHSLGVTQPAVSAQIKRLQQLLGADLLDKTAPGVSLTPTGELVVNYTRRLLSINDQVLHATGPSPQTRVVRIGVPTDMMGPALTRCLVEFRPAGLRFEVDGGATEAMIQDLRQGDVDLVIARST